MTWFRVHGGGGGEDVSEEVAVQTPLIQQIREMIVGKATDANATEDNIELGFSAYVGQKLVNGKQQGEYLWKKYELVNANISMTQKTQSNTPEFTVESSDIDLSTVDKYFFNGFKTYYTYQGSKYLIEFKERYAQINNGPTQYDYVFSPLNKTITISNWNLSGITITFDDASFLGKKYISYAISGNENKYPDSGTLGDFFYNKLFSLADETAFGYSKISIDSFIPAVDSPINSTQVHFSLGEEPELIMIMAEERPIKADALISAVIVGYSLPIQTGSKSCALTKTTSQLSNIVIERIFPNISVQGENITIDYGSAEYLAGKKYTVITMA